MNGGEGGVCVCVAAGTLLDVVEDDGEWSRRVEAAIARRAGGQPYGAAARRRLWRRGALLAPSAHRAGGDATDATDTKRLA